MEALIVDIRENVVCIETAIGEFDGCWCSLNPAELKRYILELDSDEILTTGAVEYSDDKIPSITVQDGLIYLNGLVEAIENSILFLRLYKSLIMLKISPLCDMFHLVNQFVRITLHEIKVYDTGIL